ncbi:transposase, partial [Robertkochia sediminum]|uniref:transposase n=1 Tax=Robertkochia sediminum TaxID=2785326 RepID=UPI001932E718
YAQSLEQRSKTDMLDSRVLASLGVERRLTLWSPPSPLLRDLKSLSRERSLLIRERSHEKNIEHALTNAGSYHARTLKRLKQRLVLLNKQITQVEQEMQQLMETDPELMQKMDYLMSIPGISFVAAATVIGETLGFKDITSAKQLTSYVGYDVVLRESGTMKGKSKISKKGNRHIRAVLHMPSMTAVRCNPTLKPFYMRLKSTKSKPIIGLVA